VTVAELTERELVARIQLQFPPAPGWAAVGIGDDAAVVEPERNRLEVLTVDAIVDTVHFDRRFTPPAAIGHRALAVNLSDLAAMGASPRMALLSLALPSDLPVADFEAMLGGLAALAHAHRVAVVGGNLTRTPGPLTLDVTAIGTIKRRSVMTRGGARPGDHVYVTGSIGAAVVGLALLRAGESPLDHPCVQRYLRPLPRVRIGSLLGRNRAASACIDLSDGLADGLTRLAAASEVGISIDAGALPIEDEARRWFDRHGTSPEPAAMSGGDDYELLFTARPRLRGRLASVLRHADVPITRIGTCTGERALVLAFGDGRTEPVPAGFSHFR
jgi:thiamine-monophosphate kinase